RSLHATGRAESAVPFVQNAGRRHRRRPKGSGARHGAAHERDRHAREGRERVSKPEAPFVGKIRRSLTGLTEAEGVPGWLGSRFFRSGQPLPRPDLYRSITQPPSYMVFIVLGMAGLRYHKEEDKSAWQFHVAFEGDSFWVSDWKRYAWSVDAASDDDATRERARRLVKKITNAC